MLKMLALCTLLYSVAWPQPLSQKEACEKLLPAVVRIDTGRPSHGTGFVVSPDGWILTAAHVVFDLKTGQLDTAITVTLPDGKIEFATVAPVDKNSVARDYAVLKINKPELKLPFIGLATDDGTEPAPGTDLSFAGFPFSAGTTQKFCLSATLAAAGERIQKITVNTREEEVPVQTLYFQGPSVKGISGGPIISRETGRVVGIVTTKLTGITESLEHTREQIDQPLPGGSYAVIHMGAVNLIPTVKDLIDVLDGQLANGLGSATGIADAEEALRSAQRKNRPQR